MSVTGIDVVNGAGTQEAPAPAPAPAGSPLARARAAAARQRETRTLDLPVGGGFGDALVVRYGALPLSELERYTELVEGAAPLGLAIDMAVRTCRTVLWMEGDEQHDLEVGLEPRLLEMLGWPAPRGVSLAELTSQELMDALFGHNGLAVGTHLGELMQWMTGREVSPGELSAASS